MRRVHLVNRTFLCAVCLVHMLVLGCSPAKVTIQPVDLGQDKKLDLAVQLVLSPELTEQYWAIPCAYYRTCPVALGEFFSQNADRMARAIFSNVVVSSGTGQMPATDVDAVLSARMEAVSNSEGGGGATHSQRVIVYVEWSLKTPDGEYIWAETVPGSVYEEKAFPDLYQKLFDSMFQNSLEAVRSAPEIRAFAQECARVRRQSHGRTEPHGPTPLS